MTFFEALEAMKRGKKAMIKTHTYWMEDGKLIVSRYSWDTGYAKNIATDKLLSNKWVLV